MFDPLPNGVPFPAVGDEKQTAYGGGCGNMTRPIAMRKVSEIAQSVDLPISGIGGISSGNHVLAMMR